MKLKTRKTNKLDDIADEETFHFDSFAACDHNREPINPFYTSGFWDEEEQPELQEVEEKLGDLVKIDENEGALTLIIQSDLNDRELSLVPMGDGHRMEDREFNRLLEHVDGWLIMSPMWDGRWLAFSVVRKERWIAAGRPKVLDISVSGDKPKSKVRSAGHHFLLQMMGVQEEE